MDYLAMKSELDGNVPLYSAMTDGEVASELNAPNKAHITPVKVTSLSIMSTMGRVDGSALLEKLDAAMATDAGVKWAMQSISTVGIDAGNEETRSALDALALAGVITDAESIAIKSAAESTETRAFVLGFRGIVDTEAVRIARAQ